MSTTDKKNQKDNTLDASAERSSKADAVKRNQPRRDFLKNAGMLGVGFVATAALAKKVSSYVPDPAMQKRYLNDVTPGDKVLSGREYVEMTDGEKRGYVKDLVNSYKKQTG